MHGSTASWFPQATRGGRLKVVIHCLHYQDGRTFQWSYCWGYYLLLEMTGWSLWHLVSARAGVTPWDGESLIFPSHGEQVSTLVFWISINSIFTPTSQFWQNGLNMLDDWKDCILVVGFQNVKWFSDTPTKFFQVCRPFPVGHCAIIQSCLL